MDLCDLSGVYTMTHFINTETFVFVYIEVMWCLRQYVFTKAVHVIAIIKECLCNFHTTIVSYAWIGMHNSRDASQASSSQQEERICLDGQ